MSIRSTDPYNARRIYSPSSTLLWAKQNLVSILYILGMTEADFETITIDEIVDTIKEYFFDNSMETIQEGNPTQFSNDYPRKTNSSQSFRIKQADWLLLVARRFWRQYQIALYEVNSSVERHQYG